MHTQNRNPQDTCAKRVTKYLLPPVLSLSAGAGAAWTYFQYGGIAAQTLWNAMPNLPAQGTLWNFLLQNVTLTPPPPPPDLAQIPMQAFFSQLQTEIDNGISPLSEILNQAGNDTVAGEYIWSVYQDLNRTAYTPLREPFYLPGSPPPWNIVVAIGAGAMSFVALVSLICCWCRARRKPVGYAPVSPHLPEMPALPNQVEMAEVVNKSVCTLCGGPLSQLEKASCRTQHQSCAASPNVSLRYRPLNAAE